jgi:hypothetical protein
MSDFSAEDLLRLERLQLDRLYELYPCLKQYLLHLDLEYCLNLYCSDLALAQELILDAPELLENCYLVMGCREVAIWLESDRLWQAEFTPEGIKLGIDLQEPFDAMPTATVERPQAQQKASSEQKFKSATLETVAREVAAVTGQSLEVAANLTIEAVPQSNWRYRDGNMMLPTDATLQTLTLLRDRLNGAIDKFNGVSAEPPAEANGATDSAAAIEPVEAKPPAKRSVKPAAKKSTRSAKTTAKAGTSKTVKPKTQKTGTPE